MKRYTFFDKRDRNRKPLGTITTDDKGVITGFVNEQGEDDPFFDVFIKGKETLAFASSHTPSIGATPLDDEGPNETESASEDKGEPVEKSLTERLQEVRARRGLEKVEAPVVEEQTDTVVKAEGGILKTDPAKRHVFGWAYVTHDKNGDLNIDKSGDFIDEVEEIEKAGYDFVLKSRAGDADHTNVKGADMIESIVFTPEKIEKMGLPAGSVPVGWWLGFKVHDDATWARVESGELRAFSIHGKGTRAKVEE